MKLVDLLSTIHYSINYVRYYSSVLEKYSQEEETAKRHLCSYESSLQVALNGVHYVLPFFYLLNTKGVSVIYELDFQLIINCFFTTQNFLLHPGVDIVEDRFRSSGCHSLKDMRALDSGEVWFPTGEVLD